MDGMYVSDMKVLARNATDLADRADSLCASLERSDDFDPEQMAEMHAILRAIQREAGSDASQIRSMTGSEEDVTDV